MNAAWATAAIALAVALAGLLAWGARWTFRILARTMRFLDDWAGEDARPGVTARPGVMARLQAVEQKVTDIRAETKPDGGHSLRDVVHKTAAAVDDIRVEQGRVRAELVRLQEGKR